VTEPVPTYPADLEFFPTPAPFTRWLFQRFSIRGRCADLSVGYRDLVKDAQAMLDADERTWVTNDLDPFWKADYHQDAALPDLYTQIGRVDWHIQNPPFSLAVEIAQQCLSHAQVGVAMYFRISMHEVLKSEPRRSWLRDTPPTAILHLPRFGHRRSKKTGEWSTDNVSTCWTVWIKDPGVVLGQRPVQIIDYAPEWVLQQLASYTPSYRAEVDALLGVPVIGKVAK
jgi:hypothetical protein